MKIYINFICFILIFTAFSMNAQDLSKLTPEQIEMYKKYVGSRSDAGSTTTASQIEERKINPEEKFSAPTQPTQLSGIFGSYLFSSQNLSFEPKLNIATPSHYMLGIYDELIVDISGLYEATYKLKVSTEGCIRIPNIGQVKVAGRTIEDASRSIKNEISKVYQGISSGETRVNISLGNIRSIRVTIVGDAVRPGTYTLPALATALNAIYACGGPNQTGSMRDIKVIRGGKTIANPDIYGILVDGVKPNDVSLRDDDIIRFEAYKSRIQLTGATKRIGKFELKQGENLQTLIEFAGGFSESANKNDIRVIRYTEKGRTTLQIAADYLSGFYPNSGDSIYVPFLYENQNGYIVSISGAVRVPGTYNLSDNITLKDLILKARGFEEMALVDSIEVVRANKTKTLLATDQNNSKAFRFSIDKELKINNEHSGFILENGDEVIVRYVPGFEPVRTVRVEGEIMLPGNYSILNKTERVSDIIERAGGVTKYAYPAGAFLIRSEKPDEIIAKLNNITRTNTLKQLEKKQNNSIDLNLLKNMGGNPLQNIAGIDSLNQNALDNSVLSKLFGNESVVGIDLEIIMHDKDSKMNLKLEKGDIIYIPREQQTIKVLGQVLYPTIVCYDEAYSLKNYVENSGGFADNASKKNIFVIYANGNVRGVKQMLFCRKYPEIKPGSQIVVPEKPIVIKTKASLGETVGILTSVSSMLVLIYTMLNNN